MYVTLGFRQVLIAATSSTSLFRQAFANVTDRVMQSNSLNFSIGKIEGFL